MENYIVWFLLAFALLGLEMLSGTFYMLVFGVAAAAGGLMAYLGAAVTAQFIVAAIVGVVGTAVLRTWRAKSAPRADQNLDIGAQVQIESWGEGGHARVHYRGSQWDAELESAETPRDVPLYIKDRRGSCLILSQYKAR